MCTTTSQRNVFAGWHLVFTCVLTVVLIGGFALAEEATRSCRALDFGNYFPVKLVFSPDGKLLAATVFAGTEVSGHAAEDCVMVWDTESGKQQWRRPLVMMGGASGVWPVFSPDGTILAIAESSITSRTETLTLVDASSGHQRVVIRVAGVTADFDRHIAFSPDGKLVGGCYFTPFPAIHLWTTSRGKPAFSLQRGLIDSRGLPVLQMTTFDNHLAFSLNGQLLAKRTHSGIELWEVSTRKLRIEVPAWPDTALDSTGTITQTDVPIPAWPIPLFSPDGRTLAVAAPNHHLLVIDTETGADRYIVEDFPTNVCLAMQADGKHVAGCVPDGRRLRIAMCDLATGESKQVLDWKTSSGKIITDIVFSPKGNVLAATERDIHVQPEERYLIRFWEVPSGKPLGEMAGVDIMPEPHAAADKTVEDVSLLDEGDAGDFDHRFQFGQMEFSPDGRWLAIVKRCNSGVDLWDIRATIPSASYTSNLEEPVHEAEPRIWTSADSRYSVEARLVDVVGNVAVLRRMGGIEVKVPLEKLSKEDLEYIGRREPRTLRGSTKQHP